MHKPKLLLLDEPTAGVDPKARREFWDEIHRLARDGLTVLVSTHYMDEAERCHRISYISYGKMLATGSVDEVVRNAGLTTFVVEGPRLDQVASALEGRPGVEQVAPFGTTLHVVGSDQALLEKALEDIRQREGVTVRPGETSLEDVFIQFMAAVEGQHGMNAVFSFARLGALLMKEFIQMRRDRITFAMMLGVPLMQLVLFGYAINNDPKDLPAALVATSNDHYTRAMVSALQMTGYYRFDHVVQSAAEAEALMANGTVAFLVTIPADFARRVQSGNKPQILIEADATDPAVASGAISTLGTVAQTALLREQGTQAEAAETREKPARCGGAQALQPGRHLAIQHRARPARRHPADDHGDDDLDRADPRNRARHDGESARHAGQPGRDHARQGAALSRRRRGAGDGRAGRGEAAVLDTLRGLAAAALCRQCSSSCWRWCCSATRSRRSRARRCRRCS